MQSLVVTLILIPFLALAENNPSPKPGAKETYESCKLKLDPVVKECREMAKDNDDPDIVFAICVYKGFSQHNKPCVELLVELCKEDSNQNIMCEPSKKGGKAKSGEAKKAKAIR